MKKAKFKGCHFAWTDKQGRHYEARTGDIIPIDPNNTTIMELLDAGVLEIIEEPKATEETKISLPKIKKGKK